MPCSFGTIFRDDYGQLLWNAKGASGDAGDMCFPQSSSLSLGRARQFIRAENVLASLQWVVSYPFQIILDLDRRAELIR